MDKVRFSGKELAKNSKSAVIPQNYVELKNAIIEHETEKAYRVDCIINASKSVRWFPKSQSISIGSKFYIASWLLDI